MEAFGHFVREPVDLVHQKADGQWYFWSECWVVEHGPYDTRNEAAIACRDYADSL